MHITNIIYPQNSHNNGQLGHNVATFSGQRSATYRLHALRRAPPRRAACKLAQ